jgi:hypothetical protein
MQAVGPDFEGSSDELVPLGLLETWCAQAGWDSCVWFAVISRSTSSRSANEAVLPRMHQLLLQLPGQGAPVAPSRSCWCHANQLPTWKHHLRVQLMCTLAQRRWGCVCMTIKYRLVRSSSWVKVVPTNEFNSYMRLLTSCCGCAQGGAGCGEP